MVVAYLEKIRERFQKELIGVDYSISLKIFEKKE